MCKKKLTGIILISIGIGVLLEIILPINFWSFLAGVTLIIIGGMIIKFWSKPPKKC